jgi:hypothetical protein
MGFDILRSQSNQEGTTMKIKQYNQEDKINRRIDLHPPVIRTKGVKEETRDDLLRRISFLQTCNDNLVMSLHSYHLWLFRQ